MKGVILTHNTNYQGAKIKKFEIDNKDVFFSMN